MMHEESAFKSSKGGMKGVEGSNLPALGSFLLGGIPLLGDLVDAKSPFALKKVTFIALKTGWKLNTL